MLRLGLAGIAPVGMILLNTMQAAGLFTKKVYLFGGIAQTLGQLPNIAWVWIYMVLIAALLEESNVC